MCSKHVETWNKFIVKQKFCASSWFITEINYLYVVNWKHFKSLIALVTLKSIQYVYLKSTWSNFSSRLVDMEGLSYGNTAIEFLKALHFMNREFIIWQWIVRICSQGKTYTETLPFTGSNLEIESKNACTLFDRGLFLLNGKLKILKQESLYRMFHFLIDWQALARRFIEFLLQFLKVIITAIVC